MDAKDERNSLVDDICMYLMSTGRGEEDVQDTKNALVVILEPYEITQRCTDVAVLQEDRNEYLLKKFIIAKTVKGLSKKTINYYSRELQKALREIGKTVDDITADDIRYYLAVKQRRDGITKRTADNDLRIFRTFFAYLAEDDLVTKNPTAKIDKIKYKKTEMKAFTDEEVELLRVYAKGEREKAIIETLLSTGCRVTELVNIRLDEIDGNKVLVHGKGDKDRYAYLNARAMITIELYMKERKDTNPYLFPGGYKTMVMREKKGYKRKDLREWWKDPELVSKDKPLNIGSIQVMCRRLAKRAGVDQANPHKFRRTCATMALRRGMPIEQVSKMLGHEQISTTQIYLDLSEEELELMHKKYVV